VYRIYRIVHKRERMVRCVDHVKDSMKGTIQITRIKWVEEVMRKQKSTISSL